MPFQPIKAEKLSESVVQQVEDLILRGILRPGERLPSERELAERMNVSRPSLRDAIAQLQEAGLVVSKAGSGIYVAEVLGAAFSDPLIRLFAEHEDAVFDYIAFRRDLEGLAAARAARVASDTDLAVIDTIFKKMEAAHSKRDPRDEAALDAEFHLAIIEASHNIIALHMIRSMFDLLQRGVFYNRQIMFKQSTRRDELLRQHAEINAALQARAPEAASKAVETHLDFVADSLREHQRRVQNEETAGLRLQHERDRA